MARPTDRTKSKTTGSSSLALKRGRRLGKYRLAKYLGEGGSCEVWKARDSVEGIWVALKIPLADIHGKRDNQALLREVRLVAQLRHPHIMPVKNADLIGEYAVLATELSVGTLDDCSRPMSVRRILSIAAQWPTPTASAWSIATLRRATSSFFRTAAPRSAISVSACRSKAG